MTDTEHAMLEALRDYFELWHGRHRVGAVPDNHVADAHAKLITACDEHVGEHDGRFVISED